MPVRPGIGRTTGRDALMATVPCDDAHRRSPHHRPNLSSGTSFSEMCPLMW